MSPFKDLDSGRFAFAINHKTSIMKSKSSYTGNHKFFFLSMLAIVITVASFGQSVNKTGTYNILVKGTSNLHVWSMKASGGVLSGSFNMSPGVAYVVYVPSMTFTMPVKTLKSNESLMDSRAYNTLKANKNPNISFKIMNTNQGNSHANKSTFNVTGLLTIAGVTRQVTLTGNSVSGTDGSVVISGSKKIRMTEFGVKPPSFMLGALKVGDEVTVEYTARFK
jgi:hypothetical protein